MAQVTVTIDGKNYRMACEEGQQEHLMILAGRFDRYIGHLKEQFGAIGDGRLTVMAGIMLTDELSELRKRIASLEAGARDATREGLGDRALVGALNGLAERMENLASRLTPQG